MPFKVKLAPVVCDINSMEVLARNAALIIVAMHLDQWLHPWRSYRKESEWGQLSLTFSMVAPFSQIMQKYETTQCGFPHAECQV